MTSKKQCAQCGAELDDGIRFCPMCGLGVNSHNGADGFTIITCHNCGHDMELDPTASDTARCPACGAIRVNVEKHEARIQNEKAEQKKHKFQKNCYKFCGIVMGFGAVCMLVWKFVFHESSDSSELAWIGSMLLMIGAMAGMIGSAQSGPDNDKK